MGGTRARKTSRTEAQRHAGRRRLLVALGLGGTGMVASKMTVWLGACRHGRRSPWFRLVSVMLWSVCLVPLMAGVARANIDVNGDGFPDLVWRDPATGQDIVWYLDGAGAYSSQAVLPSVPNPAWTLVTMADLNADGHPDAIWRNTTTGANVVWFLIGTTLLSQVSLETVADQTWRLLASADMNGDASPDLIWRNSLTGVTRVWYLSGTTVVGQENLPAVSDLGRVLSWTIVAAADLDGDGHADLLWRNLVSGSNIIWYMSGITKLRERALPPVKDAAWQLASASDVDGAGAARLIWYNRITGVNLVWAVTGVTVSNQYFLPTTFPPRWRPIGSGVLPATGDVDGDQHPDFVWRNTVTGAVVVWRLNGTDLAAQYSLPTVGVLAWEQVASADFNRDGYPDLVWRNRETGANVIWLMDHSTILQQVALPSVPDLNWKIVAAANINADARPDLLWRNESTTSNVVWFMDGTTLASQTELTRVSDPAWHIVAVADLDHDGYSDLIWRNLTTGADVVWFITTDSAFQLKSQTVLPPVFDLAWQVIGTSDFNGDGHPDLVWRHGTTGDNVVWFMQGATVLDQASFQTVNDTSWILRPTFP